MNKKPPTTLIRISTKQHRKLKIEAARRGQSMLRLLNALVDKGLK